MPVDQPIPGLPVVHEDDSLLVVDKPSGMLSQPGKQVSDSVLMRVLQARPGAYGPVLVHRLDMDTSGLMLLAKNRSSHRHLQQQFEHRRIGKRYAARLVRAPAALGGRIHLPLRVDLDDRPRQIVCCDHGKWATTIWHRSALADPAMVWFIPLTGRTHQLRVHAAHPLGLGIAIQGDRLYESVYVPGVRGVVASRQQAIATDDATTPPQAGRLMLHAQYLAFDHPESGRRYQLQSRVPFID